VAIWSLVHPSPDSVEHVAMDLDALIPQSWVMENTNNIVHHLLNWNPWVFPGIQNPAFV
jgi:hypothetical protein